MLAFGLSDKIWPQLLSVVWHHVRTTWKTENPIPQTSRKVKKKKGKERQRVFHIVLNFFFFNSSNDASKQIDGFCVIFIYWLQMGFFMGEKVHKDSLLFVPLTSALPQLWLG